MPSKKSSHSSVTATSHIRGNHDSSAEIVFYPLIVLTLVVWFIYRAVFKFPVWFDESVGKAIFFGFPVWLYITISKSTQIVETFSLRKFKKGLMLGLAFGGMFGFAASLFAVAMNAQQVQAVTLFVSDSFWYEFLLSLLTGFWETLFFFSWMMVVIQSKYQHWSLLKQIILVSTLFTIFHIPNSFLRFNGMAIAYQIVLMFLFSVGQAFIFARRQNGYALTLSHAIWGMVLLVHLS